MPETTPETGSVGAALRSSPVTLAVRFLCATAAGALALYLALAVVLGLTPVNGDFEPAPDGVTILLRSNGVHAEIALPYVSRAADWRAEFPSSVPAGAFISFGWGHRDFYIATRTWADLTVSHTLRALLGLGGATMHVDLIDGPAFAAGDVAVSVSEIQYRRLVAYIRDAFVRNGQGHPIEIAGAGYGRGDAFYEAKGRYGIVLTCNEWVRRALAGAGIRAPAWAPFDAALFWQLRRPATAR